VAAHHFLWFAWGDTEGEVPHEDVTLAFGSARDEAFQAVIAQLEKTDVPRGEDFLVSPPGTREARWPRHTSVGFDRGCRFVAETTSAAEDMAGRGTTYAQAGKPLTPDLGAPTPFPARRTAFGYNLTATGSLHASGQPSASSLERK
jgi:hypothetical protein